MEKQIVAVEMANGDTHMFRITYSDKMSYETTANKHHWGPIQDSPIRAQAFMTYAAMKREGLTPAETGFNEWLDTVVDIADGGTTEMDPTETET